MISLAVKSCTIAWLQYRHTVPLNYNHDLNQVNGEVISTYIHMCSTR